MTAASFLVASALLSQGPTEVPVQGLLTTGAGGTVDGTYAATMKLWDAATGGSAVWSEGPVDLTVTDGVFTTVLHGLDAATLSAHPGLWFGVTIGSEPEITRQPLLATPYAIVANRALDVACSGCIGVGALSPEVSDLIVAAAEAGYTDAQAVAAVLASGEFYTKIGTAILADLLPADGLDEVSGGLLSTTFPDTFVASDVPLDIRDQFPPGVSSTIAVPDVGLAQSFAVHVKVAGHSDTAELTVSLFPPGGGEIVLFKKANPGATSFDLTWPQDGAPVSGDLGAFVGTNIAGNWVLRVIDDTFDTNTIDGQLSAWDLQITTLSNQKVQVGGDLYLNGHQIKDLGAPSVGTDAANKAYVDASFKDRVTTATFLAVPPGASVELAHNAGSSLVMAQAWFKDPGNGLWSQTGAVVTGGDVGDGSEGAFAPASNTTLAGGTHNFTSVNIPVGVTVTVTGTSPLTLRSTGSVNIAGTLSLAGAKGTTITTSGQNSSGGAGGGGGGFAGGGNTYGDTNPGGSGGGAGGGAGGGYGSYGGGGAGGGHSTSGGVGLAGACATAGAGSSGGQSIASVEAGVLAGGGGGGAGGYGTAANAAGGGGGGGGGAVKIVAPTINVTGVLTANGGAGGDETSTRDGGGGGGGAGGSIWLVAGSVNVGLNGVTALGGAGGVVERDACYGGDGGNGSPGRVRIDSFTVNGLTNPIAISGTGSIGVAGSPLRVIQPDDNHVQVQNFGFVPLDVQVVVIVP